MTKSLLSLSKMKDLWGKHKILIILISLFIITGIIIAVAGTIFLIKRRTLAPDNSSSEKDSSTVEENSDYPPLEPFIGKTLEEVKADYPDGRDIVSNTTWGAKYYGYEYENDKIYLIVDAKDLGYINSVTVAYKEFTGCKLDETILDHVDEIMPYAGFNPEEIGTATNPGIAQGLASFYDYNEDFVISITCRIPLSGEMYYSVSYFDNPNF